MGWRAGTVILIAALIPRGFVFHSEDVAPGLYVYRLEHGTAVLTQRML